MLFYRQATPWALIRKVHFWIALGLYIYIVRACVCLSALRNAFRRLFISCVRYPMAPKLNYQYSLQNPEFNLQDFFSCKLLQKESKASGEKPTWGVQEWELFSETYAA